MAKFLIFSGSTREGSVNTKLAKATAAMAKAAGYDATLLDLSDYPLPLYDGDVEKAGIPENANKLKDLFVTHDGFVMVSPEYNGSVSPLLKNTLDWISRVPDEGTSPFKGKTAVILGASPGGLGGLRGLAHLRDILSGIGMVVMPTQVAVGNAFKEFNAEGKLTTKADMVENALQELVEFTS